MLLAQNAVSRLVGFVSQLLLAWYLLPADFGLVGLAGVVSNLVASLQYFGVEDVLLQRKGAMRYWVTHAFWLSLALGMLSGMLMLLGAPLAALAFKSGKLVNILSILAISMPLNALTTIPGTLLRADMRYGVLASYGAVENLVLSAATVLLAWRGYGVYSFVLPVPVISAAKAILFWSWAPYPQNRRTRRNNWKLLFNNSLALFGTRVINGAIGQGDYFMLGLFCSHAVVGSYYFAFRLASQPIMLLAANVNAVVYPALVQLKSDAVQQREAALKAGLLLNYAIMFVAFLQAAVARPLLEAFFGSKWLDAIVLIQLLSVGLAFDAMSWIAGSLLSARGEFARSLRYIALLGSLFFVFVGVGAVKGAAFGTALGVCAYYVGTQPIYTYCAFGLHVPPVRIAAIYLKPMSLAALAVGAGTVLARLSALGGNRVLHAAAIAAFSVLAYLGLMRFAAPDVLRELRWRMAGVLRRAAPVGERS